MKNCGQERQMNQEKRREYRKKYYAAHREQIIARVRAWEKWHRETIMNMSDEDFLVAAGFRQ